MNIDGLSLSLLVAELDNELRGGRIEKIFQPDLYTVLLWIRVPGKTVRLLLSADPSRPRMHITSAMPENPNSPPAFCMLLRKHLADGRIQSIVQHDLDRTVMLTIDVREEGGAIAAKTLIVEMMGKHSNIILVYGETILDAVRRVGAGMSRLRQVLPGRIYCLPPSQDKINLLVASSGILINTLKRQAGTLAKALMNSAMGLGPVTVKEILWRADINTDINVEAVDEQGWQRLQAAVESIVQPIRQQVSVPHVKVDSATNKIKGIAGFRLYHLAENAVEFASMSEAVDYAASLIPQAVPDKERLHKFLQTELNRLQRKQEIIEQELTQANAADDLRKRGDILMAFLPRVRSGMSCIELPDIYAEREQQTVVIELDPRATPQQNLQAYYNRYNKQKRAQQNLANQLTQIKEESKYLDSVMSMLEHALTGKEVREIEQELIAGGYLAKGSKKKPEPVSAPLTIALGEAGTITVGKNNRQNDIVTFKFANPNDLWFHTKDIPGSHVILRTAGKADPDLLHTAAMVAAYFSKARQSSNVPVDYTLRRYVKKPSGAKPGFVIYDKQNTLYVTPDEKIIEKLLKTST